MGLVLATLPRGRNPIAGGTSDFLKISQSWGGGGGKALFPYARWGAVSWSEVERGRAGWSEPE